MNRVTLFGRLGTDPEVKSVGREGTSLCKFRLATSERVKKGEKWEEETEWHSVTIWGKRADAAGKHLKKGDRLLIEGKLQTSSYEDREGVKRYSTEVIVQDFEFASDKKKGSGGNQADDDWGPSEGYGDEPPRRGR